MDTKALTAAFQAQNINLHCRWRAISQVDGRNVDPKDVVKAIHFECDSASYSRVQKTLYTLYATTKQQPTDFPLGYRMRLVPDLAQATSSQLPKIQMLLSRQRTFHTMTAKHTQYWGTTSIDYVHPKLGKSVREVLMTSAAPTHPDNTTLISARVSAGTLTVDCLINNEARAKELLNGIVPYTRYFFENEQGQASSDRSVPPDCLRAVESLFATSLVQASADQTWDPRLDGVITAQDSYIDEIAGTKHDMFDFREMEDVVILADPELTAHQQHVAELAQGRGADSIGTMHQDEDFSTIHGDTTFGNTFDNQSLATATSLDSMQTAITNQLEKHFEKHISQQLDTRFQQFQTELLSLLQTSGAVPPTVTTTGTSESLTTMTQPSQTRNDGTNAESSPAGGADAGEPP